MTFEEELKEKTRVIEKIIKDYLPREEDHSPYVETIIEAMNYSFLAGGKRLRPLLMREVFGLFADDEDILEPFLAAMEMIHTYSLVHDDLPAMDNDRLRRGKPTTWDKYGEDMGILAGDGLLTLAAETAGLAFGFCWSEADYEAAAKALRLLFAKAGLRGMLGGQVADVEAEKANAADVDAKRLLFIHANKTAALMEAAFGVGAILGGATDDEVETALSIARNVGVAFQIQDDILDVISDTDTLGKPVGSDAKNGKVTYVTLFGLEASKAAVEKLSAAALEQVEQLPGDTAFLKALIAYLVARKY